MGLAVVMDMAMTMGKKDCGYIRLTITLSIIIAIFITIYDYGYDYGYGLIAIT